MVQISQPDEAGADDSASDTTQTDFNRHRCFDLITQPAAALTAAGAALAAGDCVVLPTDTVYGIAADASNPEAIGRLLAAKRRGRDMPPPVLKITAKDFQTDAGLIKFSNDAVQKIIEDRKSVV